MQKGAKPVGKPISGQDANLHSILGRSLPPPAPTSVDQRAPKGSYLHNPKIAKCDHRPLGMLYGILKLYASPNCRAKLGRVPQNAVEGLMRRYANFGLSEARSAHGCLYD